MSPLECMARSRYTQESTQPLTQCNGSSSSWDSASQYTATLHVGVGEKWIWVFPLYGAASPIQPQGQGLAGSWGWGMGVGAFPV